MKAGDPNLVKEMEMIEVWQWVVDEQGGEGDWYFEGPPRRRIDFFEDNRDWLISIGIQK